MADPKTPGGSGDPKAATPSGGDSDLKAMELIQRSGILNKSATLDQIMSLSMTLSGAEFGSSNMVASWVFISRHFIYKGNQKN